ncbi:MAG: hypothetical protein R3D25_13215 [Geminicoccaceae bacterium]
MVDEVGRPAGAGIGQGIAGGDEEGSRPELLGPEPGRAVDHPVAEAEDDVVDPVAVFGDADHRGAAAVTRSKSSIQSSPAGATSLCRQAATPQGKTRLTSAPRSSAASANSSRSAPADAGAINDLGLDSGEGIADRGGDGGLTGQGRSRAPQ